LNTTKFKEKIQKRIKELNLKQEQVGKEIGIPNKGNFSTKLKEADKFTSEEIKKLSEILKYEFPNELLKDTEVFCEEKFNDFLSNEDELTCKIKKLEMELKEYEEKPLDRVTLSFISFFGGVITVLLIQVISKFFL